MQTTQFGTLIERQSRREGFRFSLLRGQIKKLMDENKVRMEINDMGDQGYNRDIIRAMGV